ncbi:helix-turn-helix transcriptional regulator [Mycolicibacterium austroafricanum]|uniref:Helix-turn-helix transcriptional regulator n=3 Tax=Mycobacteriaceae TaxID=1762 RepID=A0ABT8HNR3_MYCAO|nr:MULTISPECIES: helix-turn-helix transcriptional regulator [Mycolicibacterium]MDN4522391.1 helix-turn-helix transcriptional regulator [Mycolicibacterium austroafricanum]MDW5612672.1 helix-turn-helix transcriptional regulator [Mycolicibacterium sp. D5.8-2]PQP43032.1 AraC family transcriptional regulator [Mycolicibacterium austroafricanum]QRZ09087.1 helix-turn-helix transcriptional regulator [Mycolicibacterium austroafricanum]QZT59266.1 helix-turn-helix transcriptional regulator [Mycolicibacter
MVRASDRSSTQPRMLRRALDFIHENAQYDITIRDIAAAADVTPRAIQYAFREHMATTPLEYLRRVRLERAHQELKSADPAYDTVTSIAGRCGFSHPGRFSSAYKEVFGTEPSRTLRSS